MLDLIDVLLLSLLHVLGLQSVSFSGPGLYNSKWQFDSLVNDVTELYPSLTRTTHLATTFIPSNDPVPMMDSHLGIVQHTVCSQKVPVSCHKINAMVCDLLVHCGDGHDLQRFHKCKAGSKSITDDMNVLESHLYSMY